MDAARPVLDSTEKTNRSTRSSSPNSLIAEHWCHTQVKIIKMRYIWTISNFSFCRDEMGDTVRSSIFSAGPNDKFKWCLRINPKGLDDDSRDYLSLYLLLVNSGAKAEARAKFRFSLLNARKEETKAMESQRAYRFIQGKDWGFKKFIRRDVLVDEVSGLLPNDQLTIACEISVVGETVSESGQINHQPISIPENNLHEDMGFMFYKQLFTDVILVVVSVDNEENQSSSCVESTTENKPQNNALEDKPITPTTKDMQEDCPGEDVFGALSISSSVYQSNDEADDLDRKTTSSTIKDVRSPSSDVSESSSSIPNQNGNNNTEGQDVGDGSFLVNSSSNQNVSESQQTQHGNPDSNSSRSHQDDDRISHSTDPKINFPGSSSSSTHPESVTTTPNNNNSTITTNNNSLGNGSLNLKDSHSHLHIHLHYSDEGNLVEEVPASKSPKGPYEDQQNLNSSSSSSSTTSSSMVYKYRRLVSNLEADRPHVSSREDSNDCAVMATSTTNTHYDSYVNTNNNRGEISTSSSSHEFSKKVTSNEDNNNSTNTTLNSSENAHEQPTTSENSNFLAVRPATSSANRPRVLRQFHAHKAILAARSPVFAAMFEHRMEESRENRVEISDVDPETMAEVLRYIYTGQVQQLQKLAPELLAAADKYHLDRLKVMCEKALVEQLCVDNACITLGIADIYNAEQLKNYTMDYIIAHAVEICETEGFDKLTKLCPKLLNQCFRSLANQHGPLRCPLRKKPRQS